MHIFVEAIRNIANGPGNLAHISAVVATSTERHDDKIYGRFLVQFAPTFDAAGEVSGAQLTEDGERIAFITDLDAANSGILGDDAAGGLFQDMIPGLARAWAQQRREENDGWMERRLAEMRACLV